MFNLFTLSKFVIEALEDFLCCDETILSFWLKAIHNNIKGCCFVLLCYVVLNFCYIVVFLDCCVMDIDLS
jgi:hypothetical protein